MTTEPRRLPKWTKTFIPDKEVAVTPILISINVIVWLIMIATGVNWLSPTTDDVYKWGALETTAILHGEYWRLLVSNYLHAGIIHIGVNMLSLNNVGRGLERFIGKWRFLALYTSTGIFASAVSVWWHTDVVGVGASGAIVGIVGVLTALLTTNLIEKSVRMKMLRSIGISLLLMVAIGFGAGIDNAAHFGGLVAGIAGGYLIWPEIKAHYYERKTKYLGTIAAGILILGGATVLVVLVNKSSPRTVAQISEDFFAADQRVEDSLKMNVYNSCSDINTKILPVYAKGLRQIDTIESYELNPEAAEQMRRTKVYIQSKMTYFNYVCKVLSPDGEQYKDSVNRWLAKTQQDFAHIIQP